MVMRDRAVIPVLTAVIVCLLNAVKPAVVDDTAYLSHARHLATSPLDPYGFKLFWYYEPEPAMEILLPPVLPYWLALGQAFFGHQLVLLKLWLLPFALVLAFAVRSLLFRWAPAWRNEATAAFLLSPVVFPQFNVMLDVPALALGTAALAVFIRSTEVQHWRRPVMACLAGLLCGLAMQTKYTMLVLPAILLAYAVTHGSWKTFGNLMLAGLCCGLVFGGWEYLLTLKYGQSHFLRHARDAGPSESWLQKLQQKWELAQLNGPALLSQSGLLICGWAVWLVATIRTRLCRMAWIAGVGLGVAGLIAVMVLPGQRSVLLVNPVTQVVQLDVASLLAVGTALLATFTIATTLLFTGARLQPKRELAFLLSWVLLEIAGAGLLSPFPAARRLMGVSTALFVFVAFLISNLAPPRPARWTLAVPVLLGVLLFALDTWDAQAERVVAERADALVQPTGPETVWFNGHWGFQYYCERAGMKPVIPNQSLLLAGDWLVFPEVPDDVGFYRPYHGGAKFRIDHDCVATVGELIWDDALAAQTIPNFYGGTVPIKGRDHPRLKVVVYRITQDWLPPRVP